MDNSPEPIIAISLSGGGARAMAFHLGCLRALHTSGLLSRAEVLSCVSGGSVIGATYVTHDGPFESFEEKVRETLRNGFVLPALRTVLKSREGLRAVFCRTGLLGRRVGGFVIAPFRWSVSGLFKLVGVRREDRSRPAVPHRFASRTTILEETFPLCQASCPPLCFSSISQVGGIG